MLSDSIPGHHLFKMLQAARNIVFQGWEQYGNIQEPVAALSPPSPSISLHISRAVFPVFAMCCFASLGSVLGKPLYQGRSGDSQVRLILAPTQRAVASGAVLTLETG